MLTAYTVVNDDETNRHCTEFPSCTFKAIAGGAGRKLVCKNGVPDMDCGGGSVSPSCTLGDLTVLGDGTIFDAVTNLQWEQKNTAVQSGRDEGNLHDVDNWYT